MDAQNNPVQKGKKELHMGDIPIAQGKTIIDPADYEGEIVVAEHTTGNDYAAELAMNEEPVCIRIEPSAEKNASPYVPCWVNGQGPEVLMNGKWVSFQGYLPVNVTLVVKRKYVAVLAGAKRDSVETTVIERDNEDPQNVVGRVTSAVCVFSVLEDKNPKGGAWLTELRRR